jgi:hypothetical protein
MFRSKKDMDMSDEEFEKITRPHNEMWDDFMNEFIIPECCAFYLASGYETSSVWEASFDTHINTMLSMLSQSYSDVDVDKMKERISLILKVKYNYIIVNENPLEFAPAYKNK